MTRLHDVLLKPIDDNERTRRYQAVIDRYIDTLKQNWDIDRGLQGTVGMELPHETVPGYWELTDEERAAKTSPEAAKIYTGWSGRAGSAPLATAAFAWHSPISRHHHDPELVRFFENGLEFFTASIRDNGELGLYGLNGLTWAHGWDIEGLIYGLVFLWDAMAPQIRDRAIDRLQRSAQRFLEAGPKGTHGNQGCVQTLGLWLYGQLLDLPELTRASDERWQELAPKVMDDSGQVVEQYGPCMHYSYTAFSYAWFNAFVRGDGEHNERIEHVLHWFHYKHTESLYPIVGPSSRQFHPTMTAAVVDILPACEHVSARNPMFQEFADKVWQHRTDNFPDAGAVGHGASPMMWAILACPGVKEPSQQQRAAWDEPFEQHYEGIKLFGRSPLKYVLVRRDYQTHFNICDFLPLSGIQTWALEDEPALIQPTLISPSTTQAWGLDTARQGVSHNWGLFGAGAMSADGRLRPAADNSTEQSFVLARYDLLWRIVVFTKRSTVLLEFGQHGPRKTFWTLNGIEPAIPQIRDHVVSFKGRRGRIHTTVVGPPILRTMDQKKDEEPAQVLEYDCGEGWSAFAFSDESFEFGACNPLKDRVLTFSDSAGRYRLVMAEEFLVEDNPGNFTFDGFHLANDTIVERCE